MCVVIYVTFNTWGYRGTSSVRPSDGGSSVPKSEQSIPMSPTDTVPYEDGASTTSKQEPKKSFHLLAGISLVLLKC